MRSILIATRGAAVALAIALTVGLMAPAAYAATTQMTATENVNVRSGPSTTYKIVGGLYRGQTVTAVSKANGWTKIKFGSVSGNKIDYVLVEPGTEVLEAAIVRTSRDGRYPSDHFPVTATVRLAQPAAR